jgi:hypothetical protein
MSEKQLSIAPLGTREQIRKVTATIAVTDTADTVHTVAVVFEKPFVQIPEAISAINVDGLGKKGSCSVDSITKTGMNVNIYQALAGAIATGDVEVEVSLVGWRT